MAQMDWNKYPEVMPPADDRYLVVVEYMNEGHAERVVDVLPFVHDLSEAMPDEFKDEKHPGWFDTSVNFWGEKFDYFEIKEVIYWMPFPEAPEY